MFKQGVERTHSFNVQELLDKDTPRRGVVIDLPTGMAIIRACEGNETLSRSIQRAYVDQIDPDSLVVMYRRGSLKEPKNLATVANILFSSRVLQNPQEKEKRIFPERAVGMVAQTSYAPDIRAVLMWLEVPINSSDGKLGISFYSKFTWGQEVESGERTLGNIEHGLLDYLTEIPIALIDSYILKRGAGRDEGKPVKIDPTSPPIMAFRLSHSNLSINFNHGKISVDGVASSVSSDPGFEEYFQAIRQHLSIP